MKIYGSVNGATTAEDASWETYTTSKTITLTDGDGLKTVYVVIRDSVWNESTAASATITLNTSIPVVTITGPDLSVISEITGKNASKFNFTTDSGSDGDYPASTNIETTIIGTDFKTAAGGADGAYIVKVFVKNKAGTWSA